MYKGVITPDYNLVRPVLLALGAIPVIVAILIAVPLITKPDIPFSAANSRDTFEFEYTRHQLSKTSLGVTDRLAPQKTEVLVIRNDGSMTYSVTEGSDIKPMIIDTLESDRLDRLKAIIKETGFIAIESQSFPILDDITEYQKSNVKVTLNGQTNQIHWPEQDATEKFVPPIITMVEAQFAQIINRIRE